MLEVPTPDPLGVYVPAHKGANTWPLGVYVPAPDP